MAPRLSGGTAAVGVVAYQDSSDSQQFHYLPANVDLLLGETLPDFNVTYWGIGRPFFQSPPLQSSTGALLSGRATIDISEYQRGRIISEIRKAFEIQNPRLVPLNLSDVVIQPVVGAQTLQLGEKSDVIFPEALQLGTTFNYLVGTGNSLFAQFVGAQTLGSELVPNPSFGINIVGDAEFEGDPWRVKVTADLKQVWEFTRTKFNVGIGYGWFRIPLASYEEVVMEMSRSQVIKLEFIEGSLDNEKFGRQIFEMGKEMFEALNQMVNSETGFFKFEPNPEPDPSDNPESGAAWPWKAFLNASFGQQSLKSSQDLHFEREISYTGRVVQRVPASMTLAVSCNEASGDLFRDLGDAAVPCITQEKIDKFQNRLKEEFDRKSKLADKLLERFVLGEITEEQYLRAIDRLGGFTVAEDAYELTVEERKRRGVPEETFPDKVLAHLDDQDVEQLLLKPKVDFVEVFNADITNGAPLKDLHLVSSTLDGGIWVTPPPATIPNNGTAKRFGAKIEKPTRAMKGEVIYKVKNLTMPDGRLNIRFGMKGGSVLIGETGISFSHLPDPARESMSEVGNQLLASILILETLAEEEECDPSMAEKRSQIPDVA